MWVFVRALTFATAVPMLMRLSLPTMDRTLSRRFRSSQHSTLESDEVLRILRRVDGATDFGRPLVRSGCLARGLTRYYFLRRAGVPVALCFGIPQRDGKVSAERGHCWLELEGKPILEQSDPRAGFLPIYRLPGGETGTLKR